MDPTFEVRLTDNPIPTWVTGVTTFRFEHHAHIAAAYYPPLPGGGFDPGTLVIDPARFVELRVLAHTDPP